MLQNRDLRKLGVFFQKQIQLIILLLSYALLSQNNALSVPEFALYNATRLLFQSGTQLFFSIIVIKHYNKWNETMWSKKKESFVKMHFITTYDNIIVLVAH